MEPISIAEARYLHDYRLWLVFSTGEAGEVDLKRLIFKFPVAAPLRDTTEFARFHLDGWPTLAWDCGFDVDPEYLYTLATGKPTYETAVAEPVPVFTPA